MRAPAFGKEVPAGSVLIVTAGSRAWKLAKDLRHGVDHVRGAKGWERVFVECARRPVVCVPPGENPLRFDWACARDRDVFLIYSESPGDREEDGLAKGMIHAGAHEVWVINETGHVATFRRMPESP